jgi:hypothetical protein
MKTTTKLFLIPALAVLTLVGCKAKKKTVAQTTGAVEITLPFSSKEYRSDENFYRAKNVGKSPDLATSKKIAMQNATNELADAIQTMIKKVTDQYTNQRTVGKDQDFENKFEELARQVTNQTMSNIRVKDEKTFLEPNGSYTYWVALEADKNDVFKTMDSKISSDDKLKVDYDKQKFQQIFDSEMKKLADDQK